MCGLAGALDFERRDDSETLAARTQRMAASLRHRGPDAEDVWVDAEQGIALGHTRLAVIDLSPTGHQPMHSHSGRFVLAFNGEIYNHPALAAELSRAGHRFRGTSDTEVMLAAFEHWGIERALEAFNGMFAFALWDRREDELTLARDRLGEKPMYYGTGNGCFLFGSELKALRLHPSFPREIDRGAVALFLRYGYVPGPHSIYRGIRKLPPGSTLTIDLTAGPGRIAEPRRYWDLRALRGTERAARTHDPAATAARFEQLLSDSVRLRMVADVPVGAFLSGGIDSSCVTALMQSHSSGPVHTFSIGFDEDAFDEAQYARRVAEHLGTDHTELYLSADAALDLIPRLPELYDEPFADASQLPTLLVARLAREHVTVALSGDGGDELLLGYQRYAWAQRFQRALGWIPRGARTAAARRLASQSPERLNAVGRRLGGVGRRLGGGRLGDRVAKAADVLEVADGSDLYRSMLSRWKQPESLVPGSREPATVLDELAGTDASESLETMAFVDTLMYLPDDILVKVDRSSMAFSLEARVPLLDHRLVEYVWSLPPDVKVRDGQTKWLLREVLARHVPTHLFERPKQGFDVPISGWLRGALREWADDLLSPGRLREEGYLNPDEIATKWSEHRSGERDWAQHLWTVLMFQAWLEREAAPVPV